MLTDPLLLVAPVALLVLVALLAFVGCGAPEPPRSELILSLEFNVHDIPEPSGIVFHWSIDDDADAGESGGPTRQGDREDIRVSEYRIENPQAGSWSVWCSVWMSLPEGGDRELGRGRTCEFAVADDDLTVKRVKFVVEADDGGRWVVDCAGAIV